MEELTAAQHLAIARHSGRPNVADYVGAIFTDFFEQRGDRLCGEDPAILGGVAMFHGHPVTVIGTRKGKNLEENLRCNFGMPSPEGYRKARRLMEQAEKFRRPIVTLIDTSGALALAVADRVLMLEHSVYAILSPEGFASILWKDAGRSGEAADLMKLTAPELLRLRVIDEVILEPAGGAHLAPAIAYREVDQALFRHLSALSRERGSALTAARYEKFRRMGVVLPNEDAPRKEEP